MKQDTQEKRRWLAAWCAIVRIDPKTKEITIGSSSTSSPSRSRSDTAPSQG